MRVILLFICFIGIFACCDPEDPIGKSLTDISYEPIPAEISIPPEFPGLEVPTDNPTTKDGIRLGQHLFFDPILSADNSMSCNSCHFPDQSFTDNLKVSTGIDGIEGTRSAMSLVNVGFNYNGLFWDGRVKTLEEQALLPVEDPIELHNNWPNLIEKLQEIELYQELFRKAFGIESTSEMTKEMAAKALAQYQRVLISGNSKYDLVTRNLAVFTDEELNGLEMFFDRNPDLPDAECGHCHAAPLFTTNEYLNNGLDFPENYTDLGRADVTGSPLDRGKFRVPSLRNIQLTAPYMHDGRFETLAEVIDHYTKGGNPSPDSNPLILPLGLSEQQKSDLEDFLLTLIDTSYLDNSLVINPFD